MAGGDWIRLHRKLLDSQVFSDFDLLGVWVWCLLRANWRDGWFHGTSIPAGSFVTGRNSGSAECKLSPSAWYRRMTTLEQAGMITQTSNNRFTVISICKWETYQNFDVPERTANGQQADNKRTTSGQQADTIEEGKEREEGKEGKKKDKNAHASCPCGFEGFWKAYPRRVGKQAAIKAFQGTVKRLQEELRFENQDPVEFLVAKAAEFATTPKGRAGQYCPHPSTWLNEGRYDDDPTTWQERSSDGRTNRASAATGDGQRHPNDRQRESF